MTSSKKNYITLAAINIALEAEKFIAHWQNLVLWLAVAAGTALGDPVELAAAAAVLAV